MPPAISAPNRFFASREDAQRAPDQQRVERQHERGAGEAVRLAHHGEDEVGVVLGQEVELRLRRVRRRPRPVFWPEPIAIFDWLSW